ncbi:MAG: ester cyclase [Candidatus Promineifilaceae bacterium]|nr:ester cyclase [Candidatus Promineifilaceae bacterium]
MNTRTADRQSQHKSVVRRLYREVWTDADFSNVAKFVTPQVIFHFRGRSFSQSPETLILIVTRWHQAFSDLRFDVQALVAEGDFVSARVRYRGVHVGEWKGMSPTGRTVEVHEMLFFRFQEGRIAEVWEVTDEYALRQQLSTTDE